MYSFPMEEDERILKKGLANLYCDREAFNGALYLTTGRLVFVGYLLDITSKYMEEISLSHVSEIMPESSLLIIPNALRVKTIKDRDLKFVVSQRNQWLAEINKQMRTIV